MHVQHRFILSSRTPTDMKHFVLTLLFVGLLSPHHADCQNSQPYEQSDPSLDFTDFLSGVRVAFLILDEEAIQLITDYPDASNAQAYSGVYNYLNAIGFEEVRVGTEADIPSDLPSLCDKVIVSPAWEAVGSVYTNIRLGFFSCLGDKFEFRANRNVVVNAYTDIETAFLNACIEMYGYERGDFKPQNRLQLPVRQTDLSADFLMENWLKNGVQPLEGIYETTVASQHMPKYKLALVRGESDYRLIYIWGANNWADWKPGELKAILSPTNSPTLFKAEWYMSNKLPFRDAYVSFDQGRMDVLMEGLEKSLFVKIFPTANTPLPASRRTSSSGTGFALSSSGLIATNYHVINEAERIQIRGISGDFTNTYRARVVLTDPETDLALLQIDDTKFKGLGQVPYLLKGQTADVGTDIFVLGYPMRATMGDEIKLTNGIISSKSGFQGDPTSYQISAPVQPGNSGGPLFDEQGNLIGIVNAKHEGAENVSYAVKSRHLLSLIEWMDIPPTLPTLSKVSGKPLTEQVKLLRTFTYIVESE